MARTKYEIDFQSSRLGQNLYKNRDDKGKRKNEVAFRQLVYMIALFFSFLLRLRLWGGEFELPIVSLIDMKKS